MLHRCSSGRQQNVAAAPTMASTLSLFFPLPKGQWPEAACDDNSSITTSPSSPSSSSTGSVDCTLSLGTPSSRRAAEPAKLTKHGAPQAYPSVPWGVAADAADQSSYCQGSKPATGAAKAAGHDPLFMDRRCANCGTTSTPLWRNGPCGPKSLCNACGIRFKKEERRAAATAAMESGASAGCGYSAQRARYGLSAAKASHGAVSYVEGAFPCGGGDADGDAFLAWRLNVVAPAPAPAFAVWPERTSLFHFH